MESGRFESLGRAIYRAFETDPKNPGDAQKKLLAGMEGLRDYLEQLLPLKMKDAENCSADVAASRQLVVDNIREEIKCVKETISWFQESGKRRNIFDFDQWEAKQASKG